MVKNLDRLGILALALAGLAAADVRAETAKTWEFQASIYAYLPTIEGAGSFPPSDDGSASASVDIGTILDNLEFAFMGSFEARREQWGVFTDVIYMDVGGSKDGARSFGLGGAIPADVTAEVDFGLKGWVWTLAGSYRAFEDGATTLDVLAGARVLDVETELDWALTGNVGSIPLSDRSGERGADPQNWDAVVGVKGRIGLGRGGHWFAPYYVDVGTGESDFTWQAIGGVGYTFGWGDVVAAWRHTDYELDSGGALAELSFSGPAIAAVFRW